MMFYLRSLQLLIFLLFILLPSVRLYHDAIKVSFRPYTLRYGKHNTDYIHIKKKFIRLMLGLDKGQNNLFKIHENIT